ncbi:MAG: hypothetical protein ACO36I_21585, partial [Candidatus Latescibacterota bacterium]
MKKMANAFQHHEANGKWQTTNDTSAEEVSQQIEMEKMAHLLTQHMAVPKTGGLTPHAAIQQRVRATMQPRPSLTEKIRGLFHYHIPMYQAAFGVAMACFIVFASSHILSSNNTQAPQTSNNGLSLLDSTAVLGAIHQEVMRTTTSDSLGTLR